MRDETVAVVRAHWAAAFGCSADEVFTGTRVSTASGGLRGYGGIVCAWTADGLEVSVPAGDPRLGLVSAASRADLAARSWWLHEVAGPRESVLGPAIHHVLDEAPPWPDGVAPVTPAALQRLRAATDPGEWSESGFSDEPSVVIGTWGRTELLAAANLTPWLGVPSDVGVLVRRDARGQGHGHRVASAAAAQAVEAHGIARYRAQRSNLASLRIAAALGFEPVCNQLALRAR